MKIYGKKLGWAIIWLTLFIYVGFMPLGIEGIWEGIMSLIFSLVFGFFFIEMMGESFK